MNITSTNITKSTHAEVKFAWKYQLNDSQYSRKKLKLILLNMNSRQANNFAIHLWSYKDIRWRWINSSLSVYSRRADFFLTSKTIIYNFIHQIIIWNFNYFFFLIDHVCDKLFAIFSSTHTLNYTAVTFFYVCASTHTHIDKQAASLSSSLFPTHSFSSHILMCMLFFVDRRRRTHTRLLYV